MLTMEWPIVAAVFIVSAFLCGELAKKKRGRDEFVYFFIGLVLGPFALPVVLTPLPAGAGHDRTSPVKKLRFVKGQKCPVCHRETAVRYTTCEHCGQNLEPTWWSWSSGL